MRVVKKFVRDDRTEFASEMFDKVIIGNDYHLPFERIEFHIRDSDVTLVDNDSALICINYSNPAVLEKDVKGISILIHHELFRLMFKTDLPRVIEDVIIGRELLKRGFGNDMFYMYYNCIAGMRTRDMESCIKMNLPWIIFHGYDDHDSELLKRLAKKLGGGKPEARGLFNMLCTLPDGRSKNVMHLPKNIQRAVEEYGRLV